jgi:DNA polymerase III subunit delta'
LKRPAEIQEAPESDAYGDAPHPRHAGRLVGHAAAQAELLASYRSGRLPHAWLIGGPAGIGKATLAWRMARFVLANPDTSAPAVQDAPDLSVDPRHQAARLIEALAHPDFSLVRREWRPTTKNFATEIPVDAVRKATQLFHLAPAFGGWRVCIVDSADDLNRNSANALLKLIEEPPERSLFLIVAHRPGQVLPTIRSRCRKLRLEALSEDDIVQAVGGLGEPWSKASAAEVRQAAAGANGSVREALARLAPEADGVGALIEKTLASLPRSDPRAVLKLADALAGRTATEAYEAFHRSLYKRFADYALRDATTVVRAEELGALWDRIRQAARETDALNLDRRLHIMTLFHDIAETARRFGRG